jgi:hypothetical protein
MMQIYGLQSVSCLFTSTKLAGDRRSMFSFHLAACLRLQQLAPASVCRPIHPKVRTPSH